MPGPDPIKNKKPKPKLMKNMSEREARKQAIKFKEDQKGKGRIIDGEFYPAMAKGGRAEYKSGSKGCKLAMKGKGRAYGKNS